MKNLFSLIVFFASLFALPQEQEFDELLKANPELLNNPEVMDMLISREAETKIGETIGEDFSIDIDAETEEEVEISSKQFGYDFISSIPTSISATSDLPVPNDYVVSLGDKLGIILTGTVQAVYELNVGRDGSLFFPELGAINVFGETLEEVRAKISNLVEISYVGTEVSVSILELSAKKVNIIGAVKLPGTYIVSPFSTISSVLAYSGGFEEYASLREIVLIRAESRMEFDLYDLLIFGERDGDMNIQQGDTILVKSTKNLVEIKGRVNRPMIYEYKSTDTYSDLLNFSMGAMRDANIDEVYASRLENSLLSEDKISLNQQLGEANLLELNIPKKIFTRNLRGEVIGEGVTQITFESTKYKKLSDLISTLQFSDDIYPFIGVLSQDTQSKILKEKHFFSLSDPKTQDIDLKANPSIRFFSRAEIDANQGTIFSLFPRNYVKNFYFSDNFIRLPVTGEITVSTIINFYGYSGILEIEDTNISFLDGTTRNTPDQPLVSDQISAVYVPENYPQYVEVSINGLIGSPGVYNLPVGTTLDDLFKISGEIDGSLSDVSILMSRESIRAYERKILGSAKNTLIDLALSNAGNIKLGGTTATGDYEGLLQIIALAENTEVAGRVSGDLSPSSTMSKVLKLEDGDTINIIPKSNLVTIAGQVLNPITVGYAPSKTLNDYIMSAGNYTVSADSKSVFIIRSDGTSVPVNQRLFEKEILILPGDTIVVPRDFEKVSTLPLVSAAAQIISNIAFAAASLNSLSN